MIISDPLQGNIIWHTSNKGDGWVKIAISQKDQTTVLMEISADAAERLGMEIILHAREAKGKSNVRG